MGGLFSRFRSKPTTKELLEDLQKEIDTLEDHKHSTELQRKALIWRLVFYSSLIYIVVAAVWFFYYFKYSTATKKELVLCFTPLIIVPILIYIFQKFLQYFLQKIRNNEENLSELRRKKKALLEYAMETETYKVVKELLQKYDPVNFRKIFEPRPAITAAPSRVPLRGSYGEIELRRRNVSPRGPMGNPGQTITMNPSAGAPNTFSGKSPTNLPYPPPYYPRGGQRFVRPPVPPIPAMSRPVLPRERGFVDRLVDYLVGDGPSNRYALICRHCQSHNGMALKEEFEFVSFRCCYCMQFNPARNQQPPPPRLTLPAPPPSPQNAPIITEMTTSEASNSSGDETEIENVGDGDIDTSPCDDTIENKTEERTSSPIQSVNTELEVSNNHSPDATNTPTNNESNNETEDKSDGLVVEEEVPFIDDAN